MSFIIALLAGFFLIVLGVLGAVAFIMCMVMRIFMPKELKEGKKNEAFNSKRNAQNISRSRARGFGGF